MTSRAEALIVVLVCLVIAGGAVLVGTNPGGRHSALGQCLSMSTPAVGGPYFEDSTVVPKQRLMPLGLDCWWDSPRDTVGPQVAPHHSWAATAVLTLSAVVGVGAVVVALRAPEEPS